LAPQLTRDDFEYWLFDMDDALERFFSQLPPDLATRLDYAPGSLDVIEQWILSRYTDAKALLAEPEAAWLDGAARYIGETFRKTLGGMWEIRLDDPKYVYYRMPQLSGFGERPTPLSPFSLATATASRRTGRYLCGILANVRTRLGK
jgi:hypothetical protein